MTQQLKHEELGKIDTTIASGACQNLKNESGVKQIGVRMSKLWPKYAPNLTETAVATLSLNSLVLHSFSLELSSFLIGFTLGP